MAQTPASSDGIPRTSGAVRIAIATLTLAALLALSSEAAAAKTPKCLGEPATIVGTNGDDKLFGTPRADVIVGLSGHDEILGRGRDDRLCGRRGQDFLSGGRGDDQITTGPGNNGVSGDQGDDVLQGGAGGDDNANYIDAPRPVFASIKGGFAHGQGHDTLLHGIDELFGSLRYGDTLIGDKRSQLIAGFGGNDRLLGGDRNDLLAGGSGDDRIDGGRGPFDLLADGDFGGPGTRGGVRLDLGRGIERGHGRDKLTSIEGTNGGPGPDVLKGGPGPDVLIGLEGDDVISGGGGGDVVEGDAGFDRLDGGAGIDYSSSYESPTPVTVDLAAGTLIGPDPSTDSDTLVAIEDVLGSSFDDTIIGDAGPNVLRGDPGGDSISGGGGDDILLGDCSKPKNDKPRHLFYEFPFDCSSAKDPDTLDGGGDTDTCVDGETVASCERTRTSFDGDGAAARPAPTPPRSRGA